MIAALRQALLCALPVLQDGNADLALDPVSLQRVFEAAYDDVDFERIVALVEANPTRPPR
jgi:hypothetical protein